MDPVIRPGAFVIIDRHYNTLTPYHPNRPSLYAVRLHSHLVFRYLEHQAQRLILRPHNRTFPIELIDLGDSGSLAEFITGRVIQVLNET